MRRIRATRNIPRAVFARVFAVQIGGCAMFVAVRFARHRFLAAEMEVFIARITERPAAHTGTEIKDADTFALYFRGRCLFRLTLFGAALDRGGALGQAKAVRLPTTAFLPTPSSSPMRAVVQP